LKSTEKHWKAKTTHEMNHETYETVIQESYEKLWKSWNTSKHHEKYVEYQWILWRSNKIKNIENTRITDRNYETLWKAMKNNEKHRKWKTSFKKHWKHMKSSERLRQAMKTP
jgi:hypothetical protein